MLMEAVLTTHTLEIPQNEWLTGTLACSMSWLWHATHWRGQLKGYYPDLANMLQPIAIRLPDAFSWWMRAILRAILRQGVVSGSLAASGCWISCQLVDNLPLVYMCKWSVGKRHLPWECTDRVFCARTLMRGCWGLPSPRCSCGRAPAGRYSCSCLWW